jgi:hypothetical protein
VVDVDSSINSTSNSSRSWELMLNNRTNPKKTVWEKKLWWTRVLLVVVKSDNRVENEDQVRADLVVVEAIIIGEILTIIRIRITVATIIMDIKL